MAKSGWMGLERSEGVGFEASTEVIKFSSPSVNWLFGSAGGLRRGLTAILWGLPKGGKSVLLYDAISQLHQTSPTARAIFFDCEFRSDLQFGGGTSKGIDKDRLLIKATNDPVSIFDFIEKDVTAACDDGLDLQLICIDSLSAIRGLKSLNADSVGQHLIGDAAITMQTGFQRILPVLRRKKIALLCTAQARAEMDPQAQRMHKTIKMSSSFGIRHSAEYFLQVTQVEAQAGKIFDENRTDASDKPLQTGNALRIMMNESSGGGRGRTAEVMLSYEKGFVNIGAEVVKLGLNLGVLTKPEGGNSIVYKEVKHRGFQAFADALEINDALRNEIIADIMERNKTQE